MALSKSLDIVLPEVFWTRKTKKSGRRRKALEPNSIALACAFALAPLTADLPTVLKPVVPSADSVAVFFDLEEAEVGR